MLIILKHELKVVAKQMEEKLERLERIKKKPCIFV